jgi:hypothetical protein
VRTFREHSGNIQGAFSAHSVNKEGTFREHPGHIQVELKRTPVGLHPNCKMQLKKVPRLTQNTTCPHRFVQRGLT